MLKRYFLIIIISIITVFFPSCAQKENNSKQINLTISAAISLSDVLTELKTIYEEKNDDINITYNFGGSGTLSQQIQQGAPVDIFISANDQWIDPLQKEQLIVEDTLTIVATNELVLIGQSNENSGQTIEHYLTKDHATIVIGHPETVPAGKYAKQALKELNLYDELKDELILAKDVRQVLTYVETGNADYGFVYKSDALTSENSEILTNVNSNLHDPITYPGTLLANTRAEKVAKNFLLFLTSNEAKHIFESYGFSK